MQDQNRESSLSGSVSHIVFLNPENGYTIATLDHKRNGNGQVSSTIVGKILDLREGESLDLTGSWTHHPKFGSQFKFNNHSRTLPKIESGIEKYLGSGLIEGIGPELAKRIVRKFKDQALTIMDTNIDLLEQVNGIGTKRLGWIKESWNEQRSIRDLMIFLQSCQLGASYAANIQKMFGADAIELIKENPYILLKIHGIGFIIADRVALNLGIEKTSEFRIAAALYHTLQEMEKQGHSCFPNKLLSQEAEKHLQINDPELIHSVLNLMLNSKDDLYSFVMDFDYDEMVYLKSLFQAETMVAKKVQQLLNYQGRKELSALNEIKWVEQDKNIIFSDQQKEAIQLACNNNILILTGGPGTGKTTLIDAIVKIGLKNGLNIGLAAPTGRAAKQMSRVCSYPASTIHRLLEFNRTGFFNRNFANPLACDLLIIDETSMIDIRLMSSLLDALKLSTRIIFVGDVDQLPSIGPGNVYSDLILSNRIPTITLATIFRQAQDSKIVQNAHRVNCGVGLLENNNYSEDFKIIETENPDHALQIVSSLVSEQVPNTLKLDPRKSVQVLTPMHRGLCGTQNLNQSLQNILNQNGKPCFDSSSSFRTNDRVMQIRNNYEKGVFNGDMGMVLGISETKCLEVKFENRVVSYTISELQDLKMAYAITIHKSQGSEYPVVILVLLNEHYIMLQRNLLYTGITRGQRQVFLVGSKKAINIAISNNKIAARYGMLQNRIMKGAKAWSGQKM